MKLSATLGLILLCFAPLAASADGSSATPTPSNGNNAPPASGSSGPTDPISQYLKDQSIQLGLSYNQGSFIMNGVNSKSGSATLTDNGHAAVIINYTTSEHVLTKIPMKYGDAVWGLNFGGSFGQQDTDYQVAPGQSIIVGQNLGTKVTGDYFTGAPFLYLRLSPLYPGDDCYWLFGYGIGAALWHFSGNPIVYAPNPSGAGLTATSFNFSGSSKLYLYQTWRWQFHYGNWDIVATHKEIGTSFLGIINAGQTGGYYVGYTEFGIGLAYTLHF